ncbi:MAG TPA: hypothetical protein VE673_20125 [Pseudonocardiaceae bacterium]|nr:hypothetical protein [Pseudonocardiaceae bacterium]
MHDDNNPSEPVAAAPAVTTAAMSASPRLPEHDADPRRKPAHNPACRPAAAANDLPAASSGELTRPDVAEVAPRAAASTTAAHFDVDLRPASAEQDNDTDTADRRARQVAGDQITRAHRLALAAETLDQADQIDRT